MRRFARPRTFDLPPDRRHPAAGPAGHSSSADRDILGGPGLTRHTGGAVRAAGLHFCAWQGAADRGVARAASIAVRAGRTVFWVSGGGLCRL